MDRLVSIKMQPSSSSCIDLANNIINQMEQTYALMMFGGVRRGCEAYACGERQEEVTRGMKNEK